MERWYKDRIGGMFTANAEAVAELALTRPSVGMAEVGFSCEGLCTGSLSHLDNFKTGLGSVKGWSKFAHKNYELLFANSAKQVFIGVVATMLGAPSAPYLYMRGINRLFSPLCVEQLDTAKQLRRANAKALGAATQFRVWLNDTDDWQRNSALCAKSNAFYMFDHEYAAPRGETSPKVMKFIAEVALIRGRNGVCPEMRSGAVEMASRIRCLKADQLRKVAALCAENGLPVDGRIVEGLSWRTRLFERPVGEAYMQPHAKLTA